MLFPTLLRGSDERRLTIVYTNSLNGYIDYCHCKGNPRGGLVKRATEIRKIRKQFKNVFLFETGDFFTYDPDSLLSAYLIKGYQYIGYDAIVFGDQEFSIGIEGLLKYRGDLPFICNNLLLKKNTWQRFFKRYIIIQRGSIKIGVIGTIASHAFKYYPKKLLSRIKIRDQIQEIKRDIRALKGEGIDIIVLLSHSGYERDIKLQEQIKDISIIIGGHSQTLIKKPRRRKNSIIIQAGADGAHIGILELSLEKGRITFFRNSFRLPDEFHPADDRYIRKLIDNYKREAKKETEKLKF
jgi:2',3'-cyclic-nucleotide 2'-phosphodiesterase (5'-nucleotidase family)